MGDRNALTELVHMSMGKMREILEFELDPRSANFVKLMATQKEAAVSILSTAAKVDHTRHQARTGGALAKLLEKIQERSTGGE